MRFLGGIGARTATGEPIKARIRDGIEGETAIGDDENDQG
jgi:hypothetical protein